VELLELGAGLAILTDLRRISRPRKEPLAQ